MKKTGTSEREQVLQRSPSFVSSYCNNVSLLITPWDFRLTFGSILEATKHRLSIENHSEAYMSPQHAKAFALLLNDKIADYERKYGPIPEPAKKVDSSAERTS